MRNLFATFFAVAITLFNVQAGNDTISYIWRLNSLTEIDGHDVEKLGSPKVVETEYGQAIEFDGNDDRIIVDNNLVGDEEEFTLEVFFKPDGGVNKSNDPRFIHIQDPNGDDRRILFEIRVTNDDKVLMESFVMTDNSKSFGIWDSSKVYNINEWLHVAVTLKDKIYSFFVNGTFIGSRTAEYSTSLINPTGKTSIGGRMNNKNWYKGIVHNLRFTDKTVNPRDFYYVDSVGVKEVDPDPEPEAITGIMAGTGQKVYFAAKSKHVVVEALPINMFELKYSLMDVMGRTVIEGVAEVSNGNSRVGIEGQILSKGVYLFNYNLNNKIVTYKFYKY